MTWSGVVRGCIPGDEVDRSDPTHKTRFCNFLFFFKNIQYFLFCLVLSKTGSFNISGSYHYHVVLFFSQVAFITAMIVWRGKEEYLG